MPRWIAVCTALFVTFLWSTSYILNKWAFALGIAPFALAGLRYAIAALALGAVSLGRRGRRPAGPVSTAAAPAPASLLGPVGPWQYVGLGVAGYLVAQGFQYVGQFYVTPTQSTMLLSVGNTLLALIAGYLALGEAPGPRQWPGLVAGLAGVLLYYYPWRLGPSGLLGMGMILLSGTGYAIQLVANRTLLRRQAADPMALTLYPMGVGAASMLVLSALLEPWPAFSWRLALTLLWLGVVNGALAFFLWTWSQKYLQSFESSVLNNTMLLQIVALDVLLLGRQLGLREIAGLLLAGAGIAAVQLTARRTAG